MQNQILIVLLSIALIGNITGSPPERGLAEGLNEVKTALRDLRLSLADKFDDIDRKLEWTIAGKSAPGKTSSISEVLMLLRKIHEQKVQKAGRKITVRVRSEGCCGQGEKVGVQPLHRQSPIFYVNGTWVTWKAMRGFNLMTISRATGAVLKTVSFDTHEAESQGDALWNFVESIPDDTIVLVSVIDEAARSCNTNGYDAIRELGGTSLPVAYRDGYALIGYKGDNCGSRPSWSKELKRLRLDDERRGGQAQQPISLVSVIDLDNCY